MLITLLLYVGESRWRRSDSLVLAGVVGLPLALVFLLFYQHPAPPRRQDGSPSLPARSEKESGICGWSGGMVNQRWLTPGSCTR